ncbi:MAG: 50S ribosomal protein L15, partial [Gammaproteobacteria bacterium]
LKNANVIRDDILYAKVFLSGELNKAITVKGLRVSKGARSAIEAAGGKVED